MHYTFSRRSTYRAISSLALLLFGLFAVKGPVLGQNVPLTPKLLAIELEAAPTGEAADRLAGRIRLLIGPSISTGAVRKQDGVVLAFAVELARLTAVQTPRIEFSDGHAPLPLRRVGDTAVYAAVVQMPALAAGHWTMKVGNEDQAAGDYELYPVDPASIPDPSAPHGKLEQQSPFLSGVYPQTTRDWWIYVPAQYSADKPAAVIIFQDGAAYIGNVPNVLDNLIASGQMPVTVAVFIQPGTLQPGGAAHGNNQRSFEYDTVSDQYSKFLLEEILPEVEKKVKLRHDPQSRCLAGLSSGAACAFTAAWYRPDQFSKVLSWIGSYTDLAGGATGLEGAHNYPSLIRRTEKKAIRVYLQDGDHDLDNQFGNWPLANQEMAAALKFKKYEYQFVVGHGGHSGVMGTAYLPVSLRWLWQDYKP